ncbi:MAG: zf-HC2 domain-containing protein [Pseudomonadota bacterium]
MSAAGILPLLDPSSARELCALLPWFVAGTLSPDEDALVGTHLTTCLRCQHELARQRMVQVAGSYRPSGTDLETSLARLRRSAEIAAPHNTARRLLGLLMRSNLALRWISLLQIAIIVGLALWLTERHSAVQMAAADLRNNSIANVLVIFRPQTTIQDVQRILAVSHSRVIEGPMATGAYLLTVSDGQRSQAILWMRLQTAVLLAQPLNSS